MLSPASPLPPPDHLSFPFALSAAAAVSPSPGTQLHALLVKNGLFPSDHYVATALLQLHAARPDDARRVFDELPRREAIHYDLVIGAYARAGMAAEGLGVFRAMFMDGVAPDAVVLTTAITACAQAGALECGEWVHRYVERSAPELLGDAFVGSALVSMYAKCGCLEQAVRVFDGMPERNDYVWGTMVGAFAVHGRAEEAVSCLDRMAREDGVRPDGVAVLGALSACAHAGKVDDGLRLLREMSRRYGVAPGHEHYACTVDMLCRVDRLEDAVALIETMPMAPLASLSNIYLDANRKDDARRVRKLIGSRGIRKVPAYSEVEVDGVVSSFVADDQAHPQRVEIWEVLRLLADQMGGELDEGETMAELS
ncbi:hypothetical protein OsJ_12480 [Oryza sativa Japonica Group]|uniref:Uncharacterized protein n=1 Tax=Oryza sativa subsp. japonica TaxID=39947 RepID=B9FBN8_ORYSJ|nr:hypothetical protein OsJ_12480 [Oryza sativa Japonica Group]